MAVSQSLPGHDRSVFFSLSYLLPPPPEKEPPSAALHANHLSLSLNHEKSRSDLLPRMTKVAHLDPAQSLKEVSRPLLQFKSFFKSPIFGRLTISRPPPNPSLIFASGCLKVLFMVP